MNRKEGLDLFDAANYQGMVDYNLAMLMPYHLEPAGSVNFGDAGYSLNSAVGFWIARKSRDGLAQYMAQNYAPHHDLLALVHYDATIQPTPPSTKTTLSICLLTGSSRAQATKWTISWWRCAVVAHQTMSMPTGIPLF